MQASKSQSVLQLAESERQPPQQSQFHKPRRASRLVRPIIKLQPASLLTSYQSTTNLPENSGGLISGRSSRSNITISSFMAKQSQARTSPRPQPCELRKQRASQYSTMGSVLSPDAKKRLDFISAASSTIAKEQLTQINKGQKSKLRLQQNKRRTVTLPKKQLQQQKQKQPATMPIQTPNQNSSGRFLEQFTQRSKPEECVGGSARIKFPNKALLTQQVRPLELFKCHRQSSNISTATDQHSSQLRQHANHFINTTISAFGHIESARTCREDLQTTPQQRIFIRDENMLQSMTSSSVIMPQKNIPFRQQSNERSSVCSKLQNKLVLQQARYLHSQMTEFIHSSAVTDSRKVEGQILMDQLTSVLESFKTQAVAAPPSSLSIASFDQSLLKIRRRLSDLQETNLSSKQTEQRVHNSKALQQISLELANPHSQENRLRLDQLAEATSPRASQPENLPTKSPDSRDSEDEEEEEQEGAVVSMMANLPLTTDDESMIKEVIDKQQAALTFNESTLTETASYYNAEDRLPRGKRTLQTQIDTLREKMRSMIDGKKGQEEVWRRLDDVEVSDRRMALQVQTIIEQQNKLLHSYYELSTKYKEVKKENKSLRNDFADLKKSLRPSD